MHTLPSTVTAAHGSYIRRRPLALLELNNRMVNDPIRQVIAKWSRAQLKERSAAQEHFLDLCQMLGQPTPAEADAQGAWYTFEKGAGKTAGG